MLRREMPRSSRTWPLARADLDGFERQGSRPRRCLLLHGFTASPLEVKPLGEALSARGFPVTALRLPGHGTDVADLEQTTALDWIDAAEAALQRVSANAPALLAGQSMGALLSLLLAARHPERVHAVAALAAPMWFASRGARVMAPFFRWTTLWRLKPYVHKGISDLPADRLPLHFTYTKFPVRGVLALERVIGMVTRELPQVTAPLLVVHGRLDASAPFAGAQRILDLAGSKTREFVALDRSHHLLTLDVESEKVCASVGEFFERAG